MMCSLTESWEYKGDPQRIEHHLAFDAYQPYFLHYILYTIPPGSQNQLFHFEWGSTAEYIDLNYR